MSAIKKQVKTLLNKGTLTGFEVAQIVMHDLYQAYQTVEPTVFDDADGDANQKMQDRLIFPDGDELEVLKRKVLSENRAKADEYNNWLNAFQTFLSIIYGAHIHFLKISGLFYYLEELLEKYRVQGFAELTMQIRYPDIVTAKQLDELKAKQRTALLMGKQTLGWVLVEEVGNEELLAEDRLEGTPEEQAQLVVDYRKACAKFRDFIKKGKLAVTRKKEALSLLDRLIHNATDEDILGYIDQCISEEPEYKPGKPEPLLEKCTVTTKALYELGLPNWILWVDDYKHNLEGSAPYQVAVIQDPQPSSVDKNGYYMKSTRLIETPLLDPEQQFKEKLGISLKDVFMMALTNLRRLMPLFHFYRCLSRVLTAETGIPFSEKPDTWYETIKEVWKNYENHLENAITVNKKAKDSLGGIQGTLNLDDFQISPALAEQFREDLTSENARFWVNTCMKIYYEHEYEKVQTVISKDTNARHEVEAY